MNRSSWHGVWRHATSATELGLLAGNAAAVFLVAWHLFTMNERAVFFGWDPQSMLALIAVQHRFSDVLFGLGSDPIIGLGNISASINPRWFLGYRLGTGASGFIADGPLVYAICATELFVAVVLCGWLNGIGAGWSAVAGWLLTLLTWPLLGAPPLINFWQAIPHLAEILAVSIVAVTIATVRVSGGGWRACLPPVGIFLCLSYVLFATATSLILVLPIVGVFALGQILMAGDARSRWILLLSWAVLGGAALGLGYFQYFAGLLAYTAAGQFPDISKRVFTLYNGEVSLFLWTAIWDFSWAAIMSPQRMMLGAGGLGALLAVLAGPPRLRRLALCFLATEAMFVGIGISNYYLNYWFGPTIWYFELYLLPYFSLFAVLFVASPILLAWRLLRPWLTQRMQVLLPTRSSAALCLGLPVVLVAHAWQAGPGVRAAAESDWSMMIASPYPQPETPITRLLKDEIGLRPGAEFRGRVAVVIGGMFPQHREWGRYSFVQFFAQLATGNLHNGPSLWQDSIPTLLEYNTLITPFSFALMRTFFTRADDVITRNIIGMRHVDLRMLRTLGVRFVITETAIEGIEPRLTLPIATPADVKRRLSVDDDALQGFSLYLYELDDVNVGQYSPVEQRSAATANDALTLLADPGLETGRTVVVAEKLPDGLTAATLEAFTIGRGRWRVRASSEGPAVLLLPIEYSRCLSVATPQGGPAPRLFRADLMLTGVLFERRVDAEISFGYSPFYSRNCRLADLADARAMAARDAFRDRPEFGRLGRQR